jgi:hypothetical protein
VTVGTVVLAGCAVKGDHPGAGAPPRQEFAPVTVGLAKNNQPVTLHAGQQLIVRLGSPFKVPDRVTPVVHYPTELLTFSPAHVSVGTYIFDAHQAGRGQITIATPGCQGGPAKSGANYDASAPCPVLGAGGPAPPLFHVTVQVMPIGQ